MSRLVPVLALALLAAAARAAEAPTLEQLRTGVDAAGHVTDTRLRDQTGCRVLRGFTWQLELEDPGRAGKFTPVAADQTFHHGQKFRIRVEALCDLYFYVLNRNADGSEVVLLPEKTEQVALVKRGQTLMLPPEGPPFAFSPPAGTEHLRLIAAPMELPWVADKELFKLQNGQELTDKEQAVVDQLKGLRVRGVDAAVLRERKLSAGDLTAHPPQATNVRDLARALDDMKGRDVDVTATTPLGKAILMTHTSTNPTAKAILVTDIPLRHEE